MCLSFCVANITMPTSFYQCLGVKPCFESKFCQKFHIISFPDYMSLSNFTHIYSFLFPDIKTTFIGIKF